MKEARKFIESKIIGSSIKYPNTSKEENWLQVNEKDILKAIDIAYREGWYNHEKMMKGEATELIDIPLAPPPKHGPPLKIPTSLLNKPHPQIAQYYGETYKLSEDKHNYVLQEKIARKELIEAYEKIQDEKERDMLKNNFGIDHEK